MTILSMLERNAMILSFTSVSNNFVDMRFGTWNVRSLCRAGSLITVAREIAKYKLDLVGVQEVRRDRGGTEPPDEYTFFYGKGNDNHELCTGFLYIKSYQELRG
jgi:hypothetical protein